MVSIEHIILGKSDFSLQSKLLGDSQGVQSYLCCWFNLVKGKGKAACLYCCQFSSAVVYACQGLQVQLHVLLIQYMYSMCSVCSAH